MDSAKPADGPANKSKSGGALAAMSAWFRGLGLDVPTVLMMMKYAVDGVCCNSQS
jgi:hypothetical protein